jgi:HEAT repeat protein
VTGGLTSLLASLIGPLAFGVGSLCLVLVAMVVIERIHGDRQRRERARLITKIRGHLRDPGPLTLTRADREFLLANLVEVARVAGDHPFEPGATVLRAELSLAGAAERLDAEATRGRTVRRRVEAIEAIGWLRARGSVRVLGLAMADPVPDIAYAAAQALGRHQTPAAFETLVGGLESTALPRERLAALIEDSYVPGGLAALDRLTGSGDSDLRRWGSYLLGRSRDPRAQSRLSALAADPEPNVRAAAAEGLGYFEDHDSLRDLLADDQWFVRARAAKATGDSAQIGLAADLIPLLRDRTWWVRQDAAMALGRLGDHAHALLRPVLGDHDRFARNKAAETLVRSGYVQRELERLAEGAAGTETARALMLDLERAEALSVIGHELGRDPSSVAGRRMIGVLESIDEDWARELLDEALVA